MDGPGPAIRILFEEPSMSIFQGKYHLLINPKSAGGSTGRSWSELQSLIKQQLGEFTYEFTDGPGDARRLATRALTNKPNVLVVVGGDGTVSETINGVFDAPAKQRRTPIAILNQGTGGDFCRTLGVPTDLNLALQTIKSGRDIPCDVGRVECTGDNGEPLTRYFVNIAGCGMAGEVVEAVNKTDKRFGGFSYFMSSVATLFTYSKKRVRVHWENGGQSVHNIVTLAICNGQFFGGGMQVSPYSEIGDGRFEVVLVQDWNFFQSLWYSKNMYNGSIGSCRGIDIRQATRLSVEPVREDDRVLIDMDGENVGRLPLTAEILPSAVRFRV